MVSALLKRAHRRGGRRRVVTSALAVILLSAACGGAAPPPGAEPDLGEARRVRGVVATRLAQLPGLLTSMTRPTSDELLVGERSGSVWRVVRRNEDGFVRPVLDPSPALDLRGAVSTAGEQGLFDLATVDGGRAILVSYTQLDGTVVVERFPYRRGAPIDAGAGRSVVRLGWRYPWHHGGALAVLDDGSVLLGVGDQGLSPPGVPVSQDPELVLGAVLRIPADVVERADGNWNPGPDDVVARGLRNPWKMSFDRRRAEVWIGEVGNDQEEEVDRLPLDATSGGVANFGWPYLEGSVVIDDRLPSDVEFARPALTRKYGDGVCGMVGGFVYRGRALQGLRGRYLFADLCDPTVMSAERRGDGTLGRPERALELPGPVVALVEGPGGEPYALGAEGALWRLDPAWWNVADSRQRVEGPETPPDDGSAVASALDCGVIGAIYPLLHLASLRPDELRQSMQDARSVLATRVPELPSSLRPAGQVLLDTFVQLDERLAEFGWDMSSTSEPAMRLRRDMIDATGSFSEFSPALTTFMESGCR